MSLIEWEINTDVVGEIVGFARGIIEVFNDVHYVDRLATLAHNTASLEFDRAAASAASAGYLSHVYEYGTAGITEGKPRFADPTSPEARLYVHDLDGSDGTYDSQFSFRPAVAPNPPREATGTETKYNKKFAANNYIFRQRARLMEYGGEVSIKPKNGGNFLFIPSDEDVRGYMMWDASKRGPLNMTIGDKTAGTFTSFWEAWWETEGERIIDSTVDRRVRTDVNTQFTKLSRNSGVPKKPAAAQASMVAEREAKQKEVANALRASAARFATRRRK